MSPLACSLCTRLCVLFWVGGVGVGEPVIAGSLPVLVPVLIHILVPVPVLLPVLGPLS